MKVMVSKGLSSGELETDFRQLGLVNFSGMIRAKQGYSTGTGGAKSKEKEYSGHFNF